MTKELSALLDGELEAHEAPALWSRVKSDRTLHAAWSDYQLIGDAIRREDRIDADITARVMRELESEPTVLAPRAKPRQQARQSALLALAASVAGVAVVGWLALVPQPGQREAAMMVRAVPQQLPVQSAQQRPLSLASAQGVHGGQTGQGSQEYREYLLAHQANAAGLHIQGGAQHIRTVSAIGSGQ